jgi:hypothetical protein
MRNERTMNAVAVADEADNVCSFIFKNSQAINNQDNICGQLQSQVTKREFEIAKKVEAEDKPQFGKVQSVLTGLRKLEKDRASILTPVDRVKSCSRLRYPC